MSNECKIYIGTSGYSYNEWSEFGFYPPSTPQNKMLGLYAKHFNITELNYTWYQLPKPHICEKQAASVPNNFYFTAKLTRTLTHERKFRDFDSEVSAYRHGIAPIAEAAKLKAILIQLPPSFTRTLDNRRYLAKLLKALEGLPLSVEFRHSSWATPKVFEDLQKKNIVLSNVDTPQLDYLFPSGVMETGTKTFYIRFHGRNKNGWNSGNMLKQFDYDYSFKLLQDWAEKIEKLATYSSEGLIFFNNHVRAQAPRNAQELREILISKRLNVQ